MDDPVAGQILEDFSRSLAAVRALTEHPYPTLVRDAASMLERTIRTGGKVLFCGNGGSAAESLHFAAELVGRQNFDRRGVAGIALTADTAALSAIGNDYEFEYVFARQVEAIGRSGDALVAISTSGRSANVIRALHAARESGIATIAMTGSEPHDMAYADLVIAAPALETATIQELHLIIGHAMFATVERELFDNDAASGC